MPAALARGSVDEMRSEKGFPLLEEKEAEENGVTADDAEPRRELRADPHPSK